MTGQQTLQACRMRSNTLPSGVEGSATATGSCTVADAIGAVSYEASVMDASWPCKSCCSSWASHGLVLQGSDVGFKQGALCMHKRVTQRVHALGGTMERLCRSDEPLYFGSHPACVLWLESEACLRSPFRCCQLACPLQTLCTLVVGHLVCAWCRVQGSL